MTGHTLSVRRLRFGNRIANPLQARARLETALVDGASASRLGRETILCVRRMAISLPRLGQLSETLDAEMLAAARPARGMVPANANAVLFADRAELLACLARDWCAGDATGCWWWLVLFPRDDLGSVVRRAWLEDARPVPAALARLESAGLGSFFLSKVPRADRATLWRNVVNTFHLEMFDAAWSASDLSRATPAAPTPRRGTAPWAPWIDPPASLEMDAARLLIAAILLERAPAKIRSLSFAQELREWSRASIGHAPATPSPKFDPPLEIVSKSEHRQGAPHPIAPEAISYSRPPVPKQSAPAGPQDSEGSAWQPGGSPPRFEKHSTNSRVANVRSRLARRPKKGLLPSPVAAPDAGFSDPIRNQTDRLPPAPPRVEESKIVRFENGQRVASRGQALDEPVALPFAPVRAITFTEWGGSLYLVNVAIALGFYGDFTEPARNSLALPLWDFLALVAGRMIGEEFTRDPLCGLFAQFSGCAEEELPGAQFEPPTGEPLAIWLGQVCHDVEAHVAASLGLDQNRDLRSIVLKHSARIETDSTRLDAHFSLAKHPIALRLAGLDRDPGWVPAGGRGIYFHYD